MLIISDRFSSCHPIKNGLMEHELFCWRDHNDFPRVCDYEIIVLDMNIGSPYALHGVIFRLRPDVKKLLNSGGVVICMNYTTLLTHGKIQYVSDHSDLSKKEVKIAPGIGYSRFELNYDWLPSDLLLSKLNVGQIDAKSGTNFCITTKKELYIEYFKDVKTYHKTIDNIFPVKDDDCAPTGKYLFNLSQTTQLDTELIAVTKVTKEPIACKINNLNGSLIFLPQNESKDNNYLIELLLNIGKVEYEKNIAEEKTFNAPDWLQKYKTSKEITLDNEIEQLELKTKEVKSQHKRFDKINALLYGTGELLEEAVRLSLSEMGFEVESFEKGYTVDFRAQLQRFKFVLEVTGMNDKVYKNNKHFAQILQYLPDKKDDEKIILLANTYRNIEVDQRKGKEHFTEPVLKLSRDNNFCLMQTADLFRIWKSHLDNRPIQDIFRKIYEAKGEFQLTEI